MCQVTPRRDGARRAVWRECWWREAGQGPGRTPSGGQKGVYLSPAGRFRCREGLPPAILCTNSARGSGVKRILALLAASRGVCGCSKTSVIAPRLQASDQRSSGPTCPRLLLSAPESGRARLRSLTCRHSTLYYYYAAVTRVSGAAHARWPTHDVAGKSTRIPADAKKQEPNVKVIGQDPGDV